MRLIYYQDFHFTLIPELSNKKCTMEVRKIVHASLTDVNREKKYLKSHRHIMNGL